MRGLFVVIKWVRPNGNWDENGIGLHSEWDESLVNG